MRFWRTKVQRNSSKIKRIKILAIILLVGSSIALIANGVYIHARNTEREWTSDEGMDAANLTKKDRQAEQRSGGIIDLKEAEGKGPGRTAEPNSVLLAFAGDVLLDGWVDKLAEQNGMDYVFAEVKSAMELSDIAMVNLENPISSRGAKEENKEYTFRADPYYAPALHNAGINIVTLANNHILDFGVDALKDTLRNLDKNKILYIGAGMDVDSASKPVFIERRGIRIAFLGSSRVIPATTWAAGKRTPGVAVTYNPDRLVSEISKARKLADIVVVYVHWGEENKDTPVDHQKQLARLYVDSGADVVIGSHPHVLQGLEYYKGKIIAYSLGNFVFGNLRKDTMILNVRAEKGNIREVRVQPCEIMDFRPSPMKDVQQSAALLNHLESISFEVSIDAAGIVTQSLKQR